MEEQPAPEQSMPWVIVRELTEKEADERVEDGGVDVFSLGQKKFRTFTYGGNIQNGSELRDEENLVLLTDPKLVSPLVEHFNARLASILGDLIDHLAAENAHLRGDASPS